MPWSLFEEVPSVTLCSVEFVLDIVLICQFITMALGLVLLLLSSGKVVSYSFKKLGIVPPQVASGKDTITADQDKLYGFIFGKCENVIIYFLVFLEGYTALALIFTGKAIVRNEDKEKLSVYHLAGTMINTAWSILVSFAFKCAVGKIDVLK